MNSKVAGSGDDAAADVPKKPLQFSAIIILKNMVTENVPMRRRLGTDFGSFAPKYF